MTNLLGYLEKLTKLVDEGHPVDIVHLVYAKAFDKVPITRLLAKCEGLGVGWKLLAWIGEWLTGRAHGQATSW